MRNRIYKSLNEIPNFNLKTNDFSHDSADELKEKALEKYNEIFSEMSKIAIKEITDIGVKVLGI